jgi:hypothetical protein
LNKEDDMTEMDFIRKEIATWGEDVIFDLIDRGYKAACLISQVDGITVTKWSWVLTQTEPCATMAHGSDLVFTPVSQGSRL